MATQTGSYDFKSTKAAKESAEKVATNFVATDSLGMMVYDGSSGTHTPSNPGTINNVLIDSNSVDIRQGTDVLASFGATATIGLEEESNIVISNDRIDFNTEGVSNAITMKMDDDGGEITFGNRIRKPRISSATDDGSPRIYVQVPAQTSAENPQILLETSYDDTTNDRFSEARVWIQVDEEKPYIQLDNSYRVVDGLATSGCQLRLEYDGEIGMVGKPVLYGNGGSTFFKANRADTETVVSFGVGTSEACGIYHDTSRKWIINKDTNDVVNINVGTSSSTKVAGTLTIEGHSSPIGSIIEVENDTTTSIPSGTSTPLMSITLPDGVWVVRVLIRFPAMGTDRTKYVYANISGTSGATAYMYRQPCENMITNVMLTQIITAGGTYYVNVYQNSGSAKTFVAGSAAFQNIRAVRIA